MVSSRRWIEIILHVFSSFIYMFGPALLYFQQHLADKSTFSVRLASFNNGVADYWRKPKVYRDIHPDQPRILEQ